MLKKKPTEEVAAPALPTFSVSMTDKTPVRRPGTLLETIEHFANGCEGDPVWCATGALCQGGAVILQTHPRNRFAIYVKAGRDWYELLTVDPGEPQIAELMQAGALISYGYSPAEQKRQQEKEDKERAKLESWKDYIRGRGEAIKADREAAVAKRAAMQH